MKALLLAPAGWADRGSMTMRLWPAGKALPEGWVEVELAAHGFCGASLRPTQDGGFDLCACGHDRRSHVEYANHCLVRRNAQVCECQQFREKRAHGLDS